jgi:hypothetical protein
MSIPAGNTRQLRVDQTIASSSSSCTVAVASSREPALHCGAGAELSQVLACSSAATDTMISSMKVTLHHQGISAGNGAPIPHMPASLLSLCHCS